LFFTNTLIPLRFPLKCFQAAVACTVIVASLTCAPVARAAQPAGVHVEILGDSQTRSVNQPIAGAAADVAKLLQSERYGSDFHYVVFGLPPDSPVLIELGFAETFFSEPGRRVFNVIINGKQALNNFDIVAAAGGEFRSHTRRFSITPRRGYLDIEFVGVIENAKIGYIRIQGKGTNLLIGAEPGENFDQVKRAEWNANTGEIFQDEKHKAWRSGVPLGGIGTGKFEILSNGTFTNFTINNSWDLPTRNVAGTFLSVTAKASSFAGNARILRIPEPFTMSGTYADVKNVPSATYRGTYPFTDIKFKDPTLPISVRLDAFSAMIPQNERDSALPAAVLNVELTNPNKYPVAAGVALSWEDINGRGGSANKDDQYNIASVLAHSDAESSGVRGIRFTTPESGPDNRRSTFAGEYFIGAETSGSVVTRLINWNPRGRAIPWWKQFIRTGRLLKAPKTPEVWNSPLGSRASSAAVVCSSVNLRPHETRVVPFIVSWYMPKLVLNHKGSAITEHQDYTTTFSNALDVAAYVSTNRERLRRETAEWVDMVTTSSLPDWFKVQLLNSTFPMTANTVYLDDGRFSILESPEDMRGALGTMDQRMAAHAFISTMFPKLDKTELKMFGSAQQPDGRITHFIGNIHEVIGNPDVGYGITDWPDLSCSWIMQVLKQYRWSGDREFLEREYPRIIKAMQFLKSADRDNDNIPEGGSTYDYEEPGRGAFAYTASCYLGALRASEAAAKAVGDTDAATSFSKQFAASQQSTVNELWNGNYFIKRRIPGTDSVTSSSFVAALAGDWLARLSGLPSTLPDDLASTAITAIVQRHLNAFKPVPPMEVSPEGTLVNNQCFILQDEPYVGCEAIYRGLVDAGLEMLSRVYQVAFELNKNPWDECLNYGAPGGEQRGLRSYMTAPAAWHVLPALAGFSLDLPGKTLFLDPKVPSSMHGELHIPIFSQTFWAWLDYSSATSTGTLKIVRVFPAQGQQTIERVVKYMDFNGNPVGERKLNPPFAIQKDAVLPIE
jgi:uncharacterized protein (DUF608 family)